MFKLKRFYDAFKVSTRVKIVRFLSQRRRENRWAKKKGLIEPYDSSPNSYSIHVDFGHKIDSGDTCISVVCTFPSGILLYRHYEGLKNVSTTTGGEMRAYNGGVEAAKKLGLWNSTVFGDSNEGILKITSGNCANNEETEALGRIRDNVQGCENLAGLGISHTPGVRNAAADALSQAKWLGEEVFREWHVRQLLWKIEEQRPDPVTFLGVQTSRDFIAQDPKLLKQEVHLIRVISRTSGQTPGVTVMEAERVTSSGSDKVALKRILLGLQEHMSRRILDHLKSERSPIHENVLGVVGFYYDKEAVCIIEEYMDSGSIYDKIFVERQLMTEPEIANVARHVLNGLAFLEENLSHLYRDVRSSNILMDSNGGVKLAGVGTAAMIDLSVKAMTRNSTGREAVEPYKYFSPEKISGYSCTYKSDIWSLGLVLLECATGSFPFEVQTYLELVQHVTLGDIPQAPATFSENFRSFINACFVREPEARPTFADLLNHPFITGGN